MLELYEVKDGPFATQQEGLAKHGGVLPLNTKLVHSSARNGQPDAWYLLARSPVVRGSDLRDARAAQGELGRWETDFVLTQDAAQRFERFTEANIGNRLAIVLDGQVLSAPTIQSKISDNGRITGAATQEEAADLALNLARRIAARRRRLSRKSAPSGRRSAPIPSARASSPASPASSPSSSSC